MFNVTNPDKGTKHQERSHPVKYQVLNNSKIVETLV